MKQKPWPVVGAMRFSTISAKDKGSFISSRERSWEDHVSSILDPDRLQFRLRFLTEVSLPQIASQSLEPSADWFSFVLVTSTLLPDPIRAALYSAGQKYPWLTIVERGVDEWVGMGPLVRHALSEMDYSGTQVPFFSFRLDDDDTVALDYLEKVQAHVNLANVDKFLTFSRGAKILWNDKQFSIRNYEIQHRPFIAIGLGAISAFDFVSKEFASKIQTVFVGMNHYEIERTHSFIEDKAPDMFIWSHHAFQDTFGRFKSTQFSGEWSGPPQDISEKLLRFPTLMKFIK